MIVAMITGAGGQLATELVRWAPVNAQLHALAMTDLDIGDDAAVRAACAALRPTVVFNAAAYTAVDLAEREFEECDRINHRAVGSIAAACVEVGAKLVHVSTDYVFDGRSNVPYAPDHPTAPSSVYGRTKRDGELAALRAEGAAVVRTAWLYSAHGKNFMKTMIRLMEERDEVRVVADQVGSPTTAHGLARALWSIADAGLTGIHHWTNAGTASWYDFAVAIREEAAAVGFNTAKTRVVPIQTCAFPTPAPRPAMSVLAKDSTWAALGGPAEHWREGLRTVVCAYAARCAADASN